MGETDRQRRSHTLQHPNISQNHQNLSHYPDYFDPRAGFLFDGSWANNSQPQLVHRLLQSGEVGAPRQGPETQIMHYPHQHYYPLLGVQNTGNQHYPTHLQQGNFPVGARNPKEPTGRQSPYPPFDHKFSQRQQYRLTHHEPVGHPSYQQSHFPSVSTPGLYGPSPRKKNFRDQLRAEPYPCGRRINHNEGSSIANHKTPPQQLPSNFYNGPPVSALVPRFPRHARLHSPDGRRTSLSSASFVGRSSLGPILENDPNDENRSDQDRSPTLQAAQKPKEQPSAKKTTDLSPPIVRQPFSATAENQTRLSQPDQSDKCSSRTDSAGDNSNTKEQKEAPNEESFPCAVPINFPKRLALPNDNIKLNALHCFLREKVLEVFVVTPSTNTLKFRHAPSSSVGRVGFRCGFCAEARLGTVSAPEDEAPMALFYPRSISEIYRLVTSWQRCHVRKCKNLPPSLRKEWEELRHDKTRGKTVYWAESAREIGLVDCNCLAGGIRFRVDAYNGECVVAAVPN